MNSQTAMSFSPTRSMETSTASHCFKEPASTGGQRHGCFDSVCE